ncbi:3'-5' exonuclease, partial [Muriicola sp.]|uniref:3'-5' exonuclease n=1 Tax=Muriicola sp. TaxID=2020856 RepID=UPI00356A63B7
ALMTIHLAKGLEFPYVYIVGMEEDLFPSAMSMNTRSELEEERRLFYVALTRAEKQAYLTYTQNRYRWGKLIDAEPSRFLEEIDEKYIDNLTPVDNYRFKPLISSDIFGEVDKSRLRQQKPTNGTPPSPGRPSADQLRKLRKIRPNLGEPSVRTQEDIPELSVGTKVNHTRFGKGEVIKLEGAGNDKKAEIRFERGDVKKLLLRFAKLEVLN